MDDPKSGQVLNLWRISRRKHGALSIMQESRASSSVFLFQLMANLP
jgi:hypothetical protein